MKDEQTDNTGQETGSPEDHLVVSYFGPATIAVVGFKNSEGVELSKKIVIIDKVSKKLYTIAQLAERIEMPEDESRAIIDHIDAALNRLKLSGVPVEALAQAIAGGGVPPGMQGGPANLLVPKG